MSGGIQVGTEAGSEESKQLDGDVRRVAEAIAQSQNKYSFERGHKNLTAERFENSETKDKWAVPELVEMGITLGCVPDAGMFFDGPRSIMKRKLIMAGEAKFQQDGGNAIERWCKNYLLCKAINSDVKYITFMSGEGAKPGGVLYKFGHSMVSANGTNCIFHYSPSGFTYKEIFNAMIFVLELSLDFNEVKSLLNIPNTPQENLEDLIKKQDKMALENTFSTYIQDPSNPLYIVWKKLDKDDRIDARDIMLDLIADGQLNTDIASLIEDEFI